MVDIDQKVEQWKQLKASKKAIEKRLLELKQDILPFVIDKSRNGVAAQLRNLTSYRDDDVYTLMHFKRIPLDMFTRREIDENKLEELYYAGDLTDDDLRRIRDPRYTYALVEVESDVQE